MRRLVRILILFVLLGLTATAGAGFLFYKQWHGRGPLAVDATVVIDNGSSVAKIGRQLEEAGVVEDYRVFALGVRLFSEGRPLRAGEYKFGAGMSEEQVMRMLLSGATVARRITVPEGYTTAQVLALVIAADGLVGELPPDTPGEGRLLPETYFYTRGETRFTMINRMADAMQQDMQKLWDQRASDLPYDSVEKALTLASIVEKETSSPTERAHIAGVFVNRLRRGMPLQSDPTVIYAVMNGAGPLGRKISSADLQVKSAYNTYLFKGLPPGPICNPGLASIQAVLHPLATSDLYFVADGSGGHAFAATLAEHNKNVAAWRKIEAALPGDQSMTGTGTAIAADPQPVAAGTAPAPAAETVPQSAGQPTPLLAPATGGSTAAP
jgi:UPF0755 protein